MRKTPPPPPGCTPQTGQIRILPSLFAPLVAGQPHLVALEAVEWGQEIAIAEGGKTRNAHVDANRAAGLGNLRFHLALSLDADEPLARAQTDGDVFDGAQCWAR